MTAIGVFVNYLAANLLVVYAATLADNQYNLSWLPPLVIAGCCLGLARVLARGV